MCGLVGIAGDLEYKDETTLKRLLIYDYFRGTDSTGLAAVRRSGMTKLSKLASHPIDLFDMKSFNDALSGYQSSAFIGHNRAATKGKVNGNNAHPFIYGNIVGAHNGTLDHQSWKRLNEVLGYETDVDSQAIFACMEKIGIEDTIKLLEEGRTSSDGAWALTWVDLDEGEKGTLNFLRNKWRPLWYAYSEDFKKVFWASEWPMIDAAVSLAAQPYKLFQDNEGYKFFSVEENWWYRFDLADLMSGMKERPKPRVKTLKGREPAPAQMGTAPFTVHGHQHGNPNRLTWDRNGSTTTNGTTTGNGSKGGADSKIPEVVPIDASKSKPFGDYMTKQQFDYFAQHGCSWCTEDVHYEDEGVTVFESTGKILCAKCSDNNGVNRVYTHRTEVEAYYKNKAA